MRPRRQGALEVTNRKAVFGLAAMTIPVNAALGLIAWRLWRVDVISTPLFVAVLVAVMALLVVQELTVFKVNRPAMADSYAPEDQYPFRSVAVLSIAYFATFGSELAVVSMLPGFFEETWGLGPSAAGIAASGFAFVNLAARPAGGIMSDRLGSRRRTLTLVTIGLLARLRAALHDGGGLAVGARRRRLHGLFVLRPGRAPAPCSPSSRS